MPPAIIGSDIVHTVTTASNGDDEGEGEPNNYNGHDNVIGGGGDGSDYLLEYLYLKK